MKKTVLIISLLIVLLANSVIVHADGWDHYKAQPQENTETEPTAQPVVIDEPEPVIRPEKESGPITGPSKSQGKGSGGKSKFVPEKIEDPDPLEGIETQKGVVYRQYPCGDDFNFMIVYQPIMTRSQSGQTAEGMFIFFRVQIQNLTGRAIEGLKYESFTLSKGDGENAEVYPLSEFFSTVTSTLWSLGLFRDRIQVNGMLDTYLVFDVQGLYNDPWVLTFLPTERYSNEQFTPIRITLPPVNQQ